MSQPPAFEWIGGGTFLIAIGRAVDRASLAGAGGAVPGTYAADLADRIACCVFGGLVDLAAEYAAYYSEEYPTLAQFIAVRYDVPARTAARFAAAAGDAGRLVGRGDVFSGADDTMGQWLAETEQGTGALRRLLGCETAAADENDCNGEGNEADDDED